MPRLRVALLALAITLVAVWLGAATLGRRAEVAPAAGGLRPQPPPAVQEEPAWSARDLGEDVVRLRERLDQAPVPVPIGRNPFSLAVAAPEAEPLAGSGTPSPPPPAVPFEFEPVPEAHVSLTARLLGIAVDETADGPEITAMLTMADESLRFVRVGDRLPGGYRVEEVTPSSVTFADESGRSWRLDLP